jgi:GGDEF domain-containing protein
MSMMFKFSKPLSIRTMGTTMISLRKTVSELEKLDEFRKTALESYALTIGATGEHVVEIDPSQAASFRSRIEALRKLVQPNTPSKQLIEIQSALKNELREYSEKAKQVMDRLRNDVRAASGAMEAFAATFASSAMDLDGEVKRELERLDKAVRVDDLNEIRQIIRGVSPSISSSVKRMRESNELAIVQLKDEIRLLHQELKNGRQSPPAAQLSASSSQRKESFAQIDSLVKQEMPFSLMLIAVKNFQGLQRCYAKAAIENACSSLHARLAGALPSGSRADRWADSQFLAILTVESAKALLISRDLSKRLSGTHAGQDSSLPTVAIDVISGVIDWKTQDDPALLLRRLDQLSDTLSKT